MKMKRGSSGTDSIREAVREEPPLLPYSLPPVLLPSRGERRLPTPLPAYALSRRAPESTRAAISVAGRRSGAKSSLWHVMGMERWASTARRALACAGFGKI
ncbi:hypothetical protein MRX96_007788 [Rhipicephalus microplus]